MENQRIISSVYIATIICILVFLLIQVPFYVAHNKKQKEFQIEYWAKSFKMNFITSFFSILLLFNIHCNSMDIKEELFYPTYKRI